MYFIFVYYHLSPKWLDNGIGKSLQLYIKMRTILYSEGFELSKKIEFYWFLLCF